MTATRLFDRLVGNYESHRPSYPDSALAWLAARASLPALPDGPPLVIDVGAGTGILTRQLRAALGPAPRIVGIEPGHPMREAAVNGTPASLDIGYRDAPAEFLPFGDGSAVLVTTAQALHWFDRPKFYAETARVLSCGGTLAVIYNERELGHSMVRDYEALTLGTPAEDSTTQAGMGLSFIRDGSFLREIRALAAFTDVEQQTFPWQRPMTVDAMVGMALSSVRFQSAVKRLGEAQAVQRVRDIASAHADDSGTVTMPFVTFVIAARRR